MPNKSKKWPCVLTPSVAAVSKATVALHSLPEDQRTPKNLWNTVDDERKQHWITESGETMTPEIFYELVCEQEEIRKHIIRVERAFHEQNRREQEERVRVAKFATLDAPPFSPELVATKHAEGVLRSLQFDMPRILSIYDVPDPGLSVAPVALQGRAVFGWSGFGERLKANLVSSMDGLADVLRKPDLSADIQIPGRLASIEHIWQEYVQWEKRWEEQQKQLDEALDTLGYDPEDPHGMVTHSQY